MNIFLDSFDHYNVAAQKWLVLAGSAPIAATYVRTGTNGMQAANTSSATATMTVAQNLGADEDSTIIFGAAFRTNHTNAVPYFRFYGDNGTVCHVEVTIDNTGIVRAKRGPDGTLVATGTGTFSGNAGYRYIEIKATVHDTTGYIEVRIDGTTVLTFTGDTRNGGVDTLIDRVVIGLSSPGTFNVDLQIDDVYINNAVGTANNDFMGVTEVRAALPNGAGAYAQLTPSSAVANYTTVDENPANTTDYVSSTTTGHKDSYTFADISAPRNPLAVQVSALMQGAQNVVLTQRQGTTDYDLDTVTPPSAWGFRRTNQDVNPATGVQYTLADVNADEFGVRIA